MKKIYIASPYAGDTGHNIEMARQYCLHAAHQGVIPIAPHLFFTQFLNDAIPEERAMGCRFGMGLLSDCDELWVCGNRISSGMAAEIAEAERLGIPTRYIASIAAGRQIKNTISIYNGEKSERLEKLSNSEMEVWEDAEVPEYVTEWSAELYTESASTLYLAKLGGQYGVYAVNEYDYTTCENYYAGNRDAMRAGMRKDAGTIAQSEPMRDTQVYTGHGTGFGGCDEIGVFIPFETPRELALAMLTAIDENAYQSQNMDQESGPGIDTGMRPSPC